MSDLSVLFMEDERVAKWKAEREAATANLQIARMNQACARLISQHEPVTSLGIDRERLRLVLNYVRHGDMDRLNREFEELRVAEARKS